MPQSAFPNRNMSIPLTDTFAFSFFATVSKRDDIARIRAADVRAAISRGTAWLLERVENGSWTEPAPIGFYFAKLWYYERLYPLIFTVGALEKLSIGGSAAAI